MRTSSGSAGEGGRACAPRGSHASLKARLLRWAEVGVDLAEVPFEGVASGEDGLLHVGALAWEASLTKAESCQPCADGVTEVVLSAAELLTAPWAPCLTEESLLSVCTPDLRGSLSIRAAELDWNLGTLEAAGAGLDVLTPATATTLALALVRLPVGLDARFVHPKAERMLGGLFARVQGLGKEALMTLRAHEEAVVVALGEGEKRRGLVLLETQHFHFREGRAAQVRALLELTRLRYREGSIAAVVVEETLWPEVREMFKGRAAGWWALEAGDNDEVVSVFVRLVLDGTNLDEALEVARALRA